MAEPHEETKNPSGRTREGPPAWAFLLVALPVLYVLSVGPVALFAKRLDLSPRPFRAFYTPLVWLHDHTPLEKPLDWYVKLWGVD